MSAHETVSVLDLLRMLRLVEQHQPGRAEAVERLGWSPAKLKRVIATARLLGVRVTAITRGVTKPYWRLDTPGPFDAARLRRLYGKQWLEQCR